MEFTHDEYRNLINLILDNNYSICSYKNIYDYDRAVILRHDVDFSPEKAFEIAKVEFELGVRSTYFVLLATDFYNVFSKKTFDIFTEILKMGHEIGLHFDENRYEIENLEQMKKYILNEVDILSKALGYKITSVSMHRPSKLTLDRNIEFEDIINSYSNLFFKEIKYVSDSRMNWRENVLDIIESNNYDKIHILTHPFWYSKNIESTKEKLIKFLNESKQERYNNMNNNFKNLDEYIDMEI